MPRSTAHLRTHGPLTFTAMLSALTLALAVGGCERTIVTYPLETNSPPGDVGAEAQFWSDLGNRTIVSNDEGFHGLLLTEDGIDNTGSYEARVEEAKKRGWVESDWNEPANMAMQRGTLAVAICRLCKIEGGLIMRVLGPTPRYAARELVSMNIMQGTSTELQAISGLEYIAVISKAQDYNTVQAFRAQSDGLAPPGKSGKVTSAEASQPAASAKPQPETNPQPK